MGKATLALHQIPCGVCVCCPTFLCSFPLRSCGICLSSSFLLFFFFPLGLIGFIFLKNKIASLRWKEECIVNILTCLVLCVMYILFHNLLCTELTLAGLRNLSIVIMESSFMLLWLHSKSTVWGGGGGGVGRGGGWGGRLHLTTCCRRNYFPLQIHMLKSRPPVPQNGMLEIRPLQR